MKSRVLIKSVGRKVPLVNAFRGAGWYVIGEDSNKDSVALSFCDEIRDNQVVSMIVPTRDAELKSGTHRASDETIDICTDKFKFFKFCKSNGFNTPEVYFVKPRVSYSGKETECVWQEYVEGEEYSIDVFCDFEGTVISIVPRQRIKTQNGESIYSQTVSSELLVSEAEKLTKALHLIGHNCLQCFLVSGKVYWTDVNCRFGGASVVSIMAGLKSPLWLLKLVNGESVKPCIGDYKVGVVGRSYTAWEFDGL